MKLTRVSALTGNTNEMDLPVTKRQMELWNSNPRTAALPGVFPGLTFPQKEFILTGITAEEWEAFSAMNTIEIPVSRFEWIKDLGVFCADASELGGSGIAGQKSEELVLHNNKTGNAVRFKLSAVRRDREGDIESWEYRPLPSFREKFPHVRKLVIFND